MQKGEALVCVIGIGIGGGLGKVDWGAAGGKLGCEGELGRGEHGLLGVGPLGILMLRGGKGARDATWGADIWGGAGCGWWWLW